MQRAPREQPIELQLPLMYMAPGCTLAYGYAQVDNISRLTDLREKIEGEGIALRLLYAYTDRTGNKAFGIFVVDLSMSQCDVRQVASKLKRLPGMRSVEIQNPTCSLAALQNSFPRVVNEPVVTIGRELIGGTHKGIIDALGDSGETILYLLGREAGHRAASGIPNLLKSLGLALTPELIRERFNDLRVFGWANIVALRINDEFCGDVLQSEDFEAMAWDGKAPSPTCHWLRGFLEGSISTLTDQILKVSEPDCQAKGDRYCKMIFQK